MWYLIDADSVINALAGKRQAASILDDLASDGLAIGWVTVGEVYEGAFRSPTPAVQLATFREFLRPHHILDLTDPVMERFAVLRSDLRRRGELIPDFDLVLAATALQYNLTVLTFNVRHLGRVPGLSLHRPA